VQEGETRLLDQLQRVFERLVGLGREAGDQVGAEGGVGTHAAHFGDQLQRVLAAVAALHALEDHIVAGLQGQMQIRHQARLGLEQLEQVRIDLGRVDGRQAQARQVGDHAQDAADQLAQRRRPGRSVPHEVTSTPVSTTSR
jgi:hypothetical protein